MVFLKSFIFTQFANCWFKEFGVFFLPSSVNHEHNKISILDKKKNGDISDDIGKISRN